MLFFLVLVSLVLSSNLNNTSPPLTSTCDVILCENITIENFSNNDTKYTFHYIAKYITSKNYTGIMEYRGWIGDSTSGMELLEYVTQIAPFFKLSYDYDSLNICKSNHDIIVYTYTVTIGFTYNYDMVTHTDGITLNVNNSNLFSTIKYTFKTNMYNNTDFDTHTMICNGNLISNWNYPKISNHCVLDDDRVMYTELISEKMRYNC
jgi:hypothetical protein